MSQAQGGGGGRSELQLVSADKLRVNERSHLLRKMTENSDSEASVRQVTNSLIRVFTSLVGSIGR